MNANIIKSSNDFAFVVRDGTSNTATTRWIADSGASQHMIPHEHFLDTYEPISGRKVFMSDNVMIESVGKVSILVETRVKGRVRSIRMHDEGYVYQGISAHLLGYKENYQESGRGVLSKTKHIWRIVQVGELMKHPRSMWTYPPNWTWGI